MDSFSSNHIPSQSSAHPNMAQYPNTMNYSQHYSSGNSKPPPPSPYTSYSNSPINAPNPNVLFHAPSASTGYDHCPNGYPSNLMAPRVNLHAFSNEVNPISNLPTATNAPSGNHCMQSSPQCMRTNYCPSHRYPTSHLQIEDTRSNSTSSSTPNASFGHQYGTVNTAPSSTYHCNDISPSYHSNQPSFDHTCAYNSSDASHSVYYGSRASQHDNKYPPSVSGDVYQDHSRLAPHSMNHIQSYYSNQESVNERKRDENVNFAIPIRIIGNGARVNNNVSTAPTQSTKTTATTSQSAADAVTIKTIEKELAPSVDIQCAVCDTVCGNTESLVSHSKKYHKNVCGFCGKKFARNSNLKEHIRIHTGFTPYVCGVCKRGFKQQHSLKDHMRTHTGEKPFQCEMCRKRFSVKNNLKVHKRVHTGEKPYECTLCHKRFTQKGSLNTHSKKVHAPNRRRMIQKIPDLIAPK